jgi:hypothetical protein
VVRCRTEGKESEQRASECGLCDLRDATHCPSRGEHVTVTRTLSRVVDLGGGLYFQHLPFQGGGRCKNTKRRGALWVARPGPMRHEWDGPASSFDDWGTSDDHTALLRSFTAAGEVYKPSQFALSSSRPLPPLALTGRADSLLRCAVLSMVSKQWAEIKDERRRLERWSTSLEDRSIELRDARREADALMREMRERIRKSAEEQAQLQEALDEASKQAARQRAAALLSGTLRAAEVHVFASSLHDAERVELETQRSVARACESAARAATRRIVSKRTGRAWSFWVGRQRASRTAHERLRGVARRCLRQLLTYGWRGWLKRWHDDSAAWESKKASVVRLRGVVRRWHERTLTRGWSSWRGVWWARAEALRKLRHGAARILLRRLGMGFESWRAAVAKPQQDPAMVIADGPMGRAVRKLKSRELSRAWETWVGLWREAAAARAKLNAVLRRWANRTLTAGWVAWEAELAAKAAAKARVERLRGVVRRWHQRTLAQGWNSWADWCWARAEALRKLRKGASRILQRKLSAGFESWRVGARIERHEVLSRRMAPLKLLGVYQLWARVWRNARATSRVTGVAIGAWRRKLLLRGWQAWSSAARWIWRLGAKQREGALAEAKMHVAVLDEEAAGAAAQVRRRPRPAHDARAFGAAAREIAERAASSCAGPSPLRQWHATPVRLGPLLVRWPLLQSCGRVACPCPVLPLCARALPCARAVT